jgi:hypothetical protein
MEVPSQRMKKLRLQDRLSQGERSEVERIAKWQRTYAEMFRLAEANGIQAESPLTMLCCVTWKTLEIAFKHGYL